MAFAFVRNLYEQTKLPEGNEFYHNALQEIEKEGISSQVYSLLQKQRKLASTPLFFQKILKEDYMKGLYLNLFIKNQTAQLLSTFAEQEVEVIPLKGVYFSEKFFGHFAARPTSDIDLLVREGDVDKAVACVRDMGFKVEEERIPGHFHCSFSKTLPQSPIPLVVEIHWDILKKQTANLDIHQFWEEAVPIGDSPYVKELSPYHTFYLMVLHGWRHNLDSLRYFLDIIEMIHALNGNIDYEKLLREAKSHQTYIRMVRTLTIVYQQFPHLEKIKEFPYKKENVYWKYRSAKNLKKYLDFIDYQFLSYDTLKHRLIEAGHWFFPSKWEVLSQLKENEKKQNPYLSLLIKRIASFIKAIFLA